MSDEDAVRDRAASLPEKRAFSEAGPILRGLLERSPDDRVLLYNYGMMLSDEGTLDEARERLSHLVSLEPAHANGWVALGVLLSRQKREEEALAAYVFVGLRQIAPDTDPGIDFSEEYRLAAAMREAPRG